VLTRPSQGCAVPPFSWLDARVCAAAAAAAGRALEEDTFNGYTVEAGSDIFISVWNLHHSPAHWEDAQAFNPDRWARAA
jgi:cytochrome P450